MRRDLLVPMLALVIGAGCHHAARTLPSPSSALEEDHCWWAVDRTAMPTDSVAAHYASAYASLGLSAVAATRIGDTVLVHAGPSSITGLDTVEARMVAYQKGDSTHLRSFVAMSRTSSGGARIGLCGRIVRTAAVRAVSIHEPDGEERLSVWTRGH